MKLLKELVKIHAPSGEEYRLTEFILDYVQKNSANWAGKPQIFAGEGFQDCIVLSFGKPRVAIFAHMDSVGFTVKYENELITIGSPDFKSEIQLRGYDGAEEINCELIIDQEDNLRYIADREIKRGTSLTYKPHYEEDEEKITSPFIDNRLGVWVALKVAETLENGLICFTCWEEHKGGSVPFLTKFIYEKYAITKALICDITWVTSGIKHDNGVVISLRDVKIPRRVFVNKIIDIAKKHNVPYQLEVECYGSSDGGELQNQPYPIDWCFIGAPENNAHTNVEIVHKFDIFAMLKLYEILMKEL